MLEKYGDQHINADLATHVKDNGKNGVTIHFMSGLSTTLDRQQADKFLERNTDKEEPQDSQS